MKSILASLMGLFCLIAAFSFAGAQAPIGNVILGYSGGGSTRSLRRVIEREKLWEKYGLSVKSVYFGSGSVLTQALVGGNIAGSDSDIPAMLNLSIAGVLDVKLVTVAINKIDHAFIVRKNIASIQ